MKWTCTDEEFIVIYWSSGSENTESENVLWKKGGGQWEQNRLKGSERGFVCLFVFISAIVQHGQIAKDVTVLGWGGEI